MKEIIIYGGGSFARLMRHLFENETEYKIVAYVLDSTFIKQTHIDGIPILSFDNVEKIYSPDKFKMFVAIGYSNMRSRISMYEKAKQKGYRLCCYISKYAFVDKSVILGENNAIFQGCQIEPFIKIGNNNIIWSSVNLCHDVTIADHNFIAAKVIIGGFSRVGNNCFIAFNSTILHNICVANESLVGACSLVNENTEEFSRNIGIPARNVGSHKLDGIKIK